MTTSRARPFDGAIAEPRPPRQCLLYNAKPDYGSNGNDENEDYENKDDVDETVGIGITMTKMTKTTKMTWMTMTIRPGSSATPPVKL